MKKLLFILALGLLIAAPAFAGLVPCEGTACTWCHLIQLGDNIIKWLIVIAIPVVTLIFIAGGFFIMFTGQSESNYAKGKGMIQNAVIGLIILVTSWMVVNLVFQVLAGGSSITINPWHTLECKG